MLKQVLSVLALALAVVAAPRPANAELTNEQARCQKIAATQGRAYLRKTFRALMKCEKDIQRGKLPININCSVESVTLGKLNTAADKYRTKIEAKCPDAVVASLTFGGQCNGLTTADDLATCLLQEHDEGVATLIDTVFPADPVKRCAGGLDDGNLCDGDANCDGGTCGLPGWQCVFVPTPCSQVFHCPEGLCAPSRDQRNCAKMVAKVVLQQANKRMALVQRCKRKVAKGDLASDTDCVAESQDKLDTLLAKTVAKVAGKCPDAVAATELFGRSCKAATAGASVASCAACTSDREGDELITVAHGTGAIGGSATAFQIADSADCVGGALSRCRVGDYLLANDRIRVVVQGIQRNYMAGIGQFGGQIIDADLVRGMADPDRDNFEEWSVSLNIESTAHYTNLTVINDGSDGGPAVLRATGVDDLLDLLNPSSVVAGLGFTLPTSTDDKNIPVTVSTDYILEPGASFVRTQTAVQNTGVSQLKIFVGDFLNGGGQVELFQSGYGFGEPLAISPCFNPRCDAAANLVVYSGEDDADGVSYGYAQEAPGTTTFTTSGVTVPQLGVDVTLALLGFQQPNQTFAPMGSPGDNLTFERLFIVGDGSVSSVMDTRNAAQCLPVGTLSGNVTAGGVPAAGADIAILGDLDDGPGDGGLIHAQLLRNVVTHTRTDANGDYSLTLLPGDYSVVGNVDGVPYELSSPAPVEHPVTITAFETATANIALPATGGLQVTVVDESSNPIAARVSVVGFDPSPDPLNTQSIFAIVSNVTGVFGERSEDGFPFGVAFATFADASGDTGVVPLEPGSYRVVVSHGPEYSIDVADITVTGGATEVVNAVVERVIDTTGFVSGDFHVHAIDSPDSEVSRAERVVSMLGEGVDFFATTDHGFRADFSSTVSDLGVGSLISTTVGQEITTFDYGHFNAWPLDFDPALPNGGFVDHGGAAPDGQDYPSFGNYSEPPEQIIQLAHDAYDSDPNTVQINHIHSHFGIQGGSGLAIDTGVEPPASGDSSKLGPARRLDPAITNYFSEEFDALEIWIGDDRGQIFGNLLGENAGNWFNLINQGIVSTGIADSDTHRRFLTQSGFPRSMAASLVDNPALLDQDAVSASVNAGRVVGTNAPMVRVTAHASSTGQSGGLDLGRCTGVVACTNTSDCPPCTSTGDCGVGETCTALPTEIATSDGAVDVTVDVQSPEWAEFDKVEFYVNTTTTRHTATGVETGAGTINVNSYSLNPDYVKIAPTDFTVSSVPVLGTSSSRLEARTTLSLTGLTGDVWVVAMVVGSDGTSRPLFPVIPNSLKTSTNTTLANLIDGNLGEDGVTARAFTNPVFVDVDGSGWDADGVQITP